MSPLNKSALHCTIYALALLSGLTWTAAHAQSTSVRGRVVDQDGKPISDLVVEAGAGAMGSTLSWARGHLATARTDDQGRFKLTVPYEGVLYQLLVAKLGYSSSPVQFIPGSPQELVVRLQRGLHDGHVRGAIVDDERRGARGIEVQLICEYGFSAATTTDASGMFDFGDLPNYIGQGVLVAKSAGRVVPLKIVRANDRNPTVLPLVDSARVAGKVTDRQNGQAIAGATITLRPWFASGLRLQGTSDAEGNWQIEQIPPGEYIVEADAANHFDKPPRGSTTNRERIKLVGLQSLELNIAMDRKAIVAGMVVDTKGKPVGGAVIGIPATWEGDYRDQVRTTRSDAQGRFEIATGHVDESLTLAAFHGYSGLAHVQVQPLKIGERRNDLRITLPGTVRVKGVITDAAGRQVPRVRCSAEWVSTDVTDLCDDQGRFDLGRVPLRPQPAQGKEAAIRLWTPRPAQDDGYVLFPDGHQSVPLPAGDVTKMMFYEHTRFTFAAEPGQTVELKVTLKQSDLLTIRGRIVDAAGKGLAEASAHVFAGAADQNWSVLVAPGMQLGGSEKGTRSRLLGGARCDAEGRFRVFVVRADGEDRPEGTLISVGLVAEGKALRLLADVIVPKDNRELDLKDLTSSSPAAGTQPTPAPAW